MRNFVSVRASGTERFTTGTMSKTQSGSFKSQSEKLSSESRAAFKSRRKNAGHVTSVLGYSDQVKMNAS